MEVAARSSPQLEQMPSCKILFSPLVDGHSYSLLALKWSESRSVVSDSLQPHGLYNLWNSPDQNTGVGSLSLLQGIFPTQGWNPGLPHCRRILYQLSHKGSPKAWIFLPGVPICDSCLTGMSLPCKNACTAFSFDWISFFPSLLLFINPESVSKYLFKNLEFEERDKETGRGEEREYGAYVLNHLLCFAKQFFQCIIIFHFCEYCFFLGHRVQ